MTTDRLRRFSRVRIPVAGAAVALAVVMMSAAPALATHEITEGQTFYSDGTTAKATTVGSTLTVNATGVPFGASCNSGRRACGVDGGIPTDPYIAYWLITVGHHYTLDGKDIPCYDGFQFVDNVPRYVQADHTIPNSSFTVPSLASGQWEVCFYSQPFNIVTAAATFTLP